jgi:hypothetical protein
MEAVEHIKLKTTAPRRIIHVWFDISRQQFKPVIELAVKFLRDI